MFDGLHTERGGDMGLSGARTANQHDIVGNIDKVATVKLSDQRLVDLAAGKVEAGKIPIGREPRDLELIGDGPHLALGRLGLEQLGEHRNGGFERRRPLCHEIGNGLCHTVHLEASEHHDDSATGRIMTHGGSPDAAHHSVRHWPSAH